jgi:hypothetical protein
MTARPPLRRLIDLPGVRDLEFRAVMKREFAEPEARAEHPEIDEVSRAIFGITADEAETVARPADWDGAESWAVGKQVFAFEDAGWDVTDDKRRPLRMLGHFNAQLWLALRGVAGSLPFLAEAPEKSDGWGSNLAAEAARFRKR